MPTKQKARRLPKSSFPWMSKEAGKMADNQMGVTVKKDTNLHYVSIILVSIVFTLIACADGGSGNGDVEGNDTDLETIRSGPENI